MRVLMPGRILDRHVGGNTTYARAIAAGLTASGVEVRPISAGNHPLTTLVRETAAGLTRARGGEEVLHFVADTGPLIRTRRPSVVTVHGIASRWISVARGPVQEATWRLRVLRAIRATRRVITVSQSSRADISAVFEVAPEDIVVIPHGIDFDRFAAPTKLSDDLLSQLPENFVLYLGNIEPRKNLIALVDAMESPKMRETGLRLVIAGKPAWNAADALRRIESSDRVVRVGFVSDEDRAALMQACTLFAFPSLYEGFGFPVLEAMAAGAPVVASRRGSLAEIAGPAYEIDELDSAGIAAGLLRALEDDADAETRRVRGQAWARRFTWERSVEKHLAVYSSLLESA